nr:putative reverse transcriptase domain-containing protein [Tanacetum cinerariifolium]
VVVDRLTKSAHFLPIRKDYSVSRLAEIFNKRSYDYMVLHQRLYQTETHVSRLVFGKAWGTRLKFSTAFHPQTDGQIEFANNNSWHASIKCAPFEMLYGRKCRSPICWDQVGERVIEGPEMIEVTNKKVGVAKEKLKEARTRQKSYADKHRRSLEFQPGDHVFLKVSPARGVRRFGIKGKLSPRFIEPFEILDRVGEVSYRLALPPQLSHVHNRDVVDKKGSIFRAVPNNVPRYYKRIGADDDKLVGLFWAMNKQLGTMPLLVISSPLMLLFAQTVGFILSCNRLISVNLQWILHTVTATHLCHP